MRKIITVFILLFITVSTFAQTGFNYKAIIKDVNGNVVSNQDIDIRFTLQTVSAPFISSYQEVHSTTTDSNGLIIVNIGEGTIIVGTFPQTFWIPNILLVTEIDIEQDGTFINLGQTNFKKVPMAIHAVRADNVFSGDYNDLTNQPALPNGLEQITENGNTGWRLIGRNAANYGNIGSNAVDLNYNDGAFLSETGAVGEYSTAMGYATSASGSVSTAMGSTTTASGGSSTAMGTTTIASGSASTAMGNGTSASSLYSTAMGFLTTSSGLASTAMGRSTEASGDYATAMGTFTTAKSYAETTIGSYNTNYTPTSTMNWSASDRIFNIGNGAGNSNRSDALTVLKNGTITAPSFSISEIDNAGNNALITKEYADTNYLMANGSGDISIDGELQQTSTGNANLVPLAYGIVESTGSVLSGTGNFTAFLSGNVFIIDVNGTESLSYNNTVSIITPISTAARTSSTILSDGNGDSDVDLNVRIFNASGTQVTTTFQFVIYKL